jgi:hypothetical protein
MYSPRQEALELTWRRAALGRLIIGHSDCGFLRTALRRMISFNSGVNARRTRFNSAKLSDHVVSC